MKVKAARCINGRVSITGDKSISHRAAIIAALAQGQSRLINFSRSQDCRSTLDCLRRIGVSIETNSDSVHINGRGLIGFRESPRALDCGNSGSTMRMLAGVLAGQNFVSELRGDQSLSSRPMRRIIEPLEMMGARVESVGGNPPLRISRNQPLQPIEYHLPVASAQVKTCVLFAGLNAEGRTSVIEVEDTRDHTERLLRWYDAPIDVRKAENGATEISVAEGPGFAGRDVNIPADISSAAFLIAAAALMPGSNLTIEGVGLNPTRTQFLSELKSLGADITVANVREICNEPVGDVYVTGGMDSRATKTVSGTLIPQLIDELPLLAVVGTQVSGGIQIRDAAELRLKESDRISATVQNLRAMGAEVEEDKNGLAVSGPTRLRGAVLDSHGDHRIAMAFTIAALTAHGDSEIKGAECVAVSFPGFFELLDSVVVR